MDRIKGFLIYQAMSFMALICPSLLGEMLARTIQKVHKKGYLDDVLNYKTK